MCHHGLLPTSMSHPFSFHNSSLGFVGGKHYQKMTIPFPGCFPYILSYRYIPSLLSSGWFVIAVCFSQGTS